MRYNMKKYNEKSNVVGTLVKKYREQKNYSKADLSRKLDLMGVNLDGTEIKRIEDNVQVLKDFELIAMIKVLDINLNELENLID